MERITSTMPEYQEKGEEIFRNLGDTENYDHLIITIKKDSGATSIAHSMSIPEILSVLSQVGLSLLELEEETERKGKIQ